MNILAERLGLAPARSTAGASRLWVAKLYYLFFFGAIGAIAPFFNVYLSERGLSGMEIGVINSVPPLVSLLANPLWGGIADRWRIHRAVMTLCVLMTALVVLPFIWVTGFGPLLLLVVLMTFFRAPVPALLDSTTMEMVGRAGTSYGRQRLFGSIGFVVASYSLGQLVTAHTLDLIFWVQALLFGVGCGALSLLLPMQTRGKSVQLWRGLRLLVQRRSYLVFLAMNILMGMGAAAFITFAGLRILALGGNEQQVGLGFALNSIAEIPVMFVGGQLLARYSLRKLIVAPLFVFSIVYVGVALAPTAVVVLSLLPLLGLSYGLFWPAVVTFASKAAPSGMEATGQALMGAAQGGLGWALGALLSGFLWDAAGGAAVFVMAAVAMCAAAMVFMVGLRAAPVAQRAATEFSEP